MHVLFVGLNYKTTAVELREKIAFSQSDLPLAYERLRHLGFSEATIISTCNRVEVYCIADDVDGGLEKIRLFLSDFHNVPLLELEPHLKMLHDMEAVHHLFAVASSLESMVLGETQIQGQIKQAFETAREAGLVGANLSALFQNALTVGKRVRNQTAISEHSLSISHAAINLLVRKFHDLSSRNIVVVGNGKMSSMAVKTLIKKGVTRLTIINRTEGRGQQTAQELNIDACGFDQLGACLKKADIVICSTGAPYAILSKEMIAGVVAERGSRPMTIIDIAVPRDVEPEVRDIDAVALYNIDTFQADIEANREKRTKEINHVRKIVNDAVDNFYAWLQTSEVKPVITELKKLAEEIRTQELERALRKFGSELSDNDSQIIHDLTCRIINKVLHQPITRLREEAGEGNGYEYTHALRHLFGLEETSSVNRIECS